MSPQNVTEGRRISDSATEMTQLVLPQHANVHGTLLGGTVMHWVDLAAAIVANRHSRRPVVTAAFDEMSFLAPINVGQVALIHARMTFVDRSSMEIRVDVQSEDVLTGERRTTGTAYVTFVALDPVTRRPTPVPPLVLETDADRERPGRRNRDLVARQGRVDGPGDPGRGGHDGDYDGQGGDMSGDLLEGDGHP